MAGMMYRFSFYRDGAQPVWERDLAVADDMAAIAEGKLLLGGQAVITKSTNMSVRVARLGDEQEQVQSLGSWALRNGDPRWKPEA